MTELTFHNIWEESTFLERHIIANKIPTLSRGEIEYIKNVVEEGDLADRQAQFREDNPIWNKVFQFYKKRWPYTLLGAIVWTVAAGIFSELHWYYSTMYAAFIVVMTACVTSWLTWKWGSFPKEKVRWTVQDYVGEEFLAQHPFEHITLNKLLCCPDRSLVRLELEWHPRSVTEFLALVTTDGSNERAYVDHRQKRVVEAEPTSPPLRILG